ncbi:Ig-like domain-containing protein [Frigoriflavimonas asaccharolytica]|uniref:Tandem-95 repeat protein n=1 Tax=Frigoriflavimonas asaccharolytica TaxID=2735899 RepID=A0A8J8GBZ6_9FLAO|nr:tandem-95 repeat protein [Frigoriflavimonas asaccharolytica]NRS93160.1 hypothetical protein [Frigoriflavimonas asaccharolytica]
MKTSQLYSKNKSFAVLIIFLFLTTGFTFAQVVPHKTKPNLTSETTFIGKNEKKSFSKFGLTIQSRTQLGETQLELSTQAVKINDFYSIGKVVGIHPKNNTNLEAELVFHYQDSELNGIDENKLILYSSIDNGKTWQAHENSLVDTQNNTIRLEKLKHFSLWTAAAVLVPDTASTLQNKPVTVNVLANDTGILSDAVLIVGVPTKGTAVVNPNRTVTYSPNSSFFGTDTFVYAIDNNVQPTTAANDKFIVAQSASTTLDVLSNDFDPNSDPLTVTILTAPNHGVVVVNANNTVSYTPTGDYLGLDTFTYQIDDGNGHTDTATVQVTVYQNIGASTIHYIPPRPQTGGQDAGSRINMVISTNNPAGATGIISFPGFTTADVPFTISKNVPFTFRMDNCTTNNPLEGPDHGISHLYNTVENKGMKIVTNVDVQVQVAQDVAAWQSLLVSKGQAALGNDFYAGSMAGATRLFGDANMTGDFISVMAVQDNTTVTFDVPTGATWTFKGTLLQTITVVLNAGQTYIVRAPATTTSLTSISGAHVVSSKPISFTSGTFGVTLPSAGDNGYDQGVPTHRIGSTYAVVKATSTNERIRIIATKPNTVITHNGTVVATKNAGEVHEIALPGSAGLAHSITSTEPVYLYQTSGSNLGETGVALIAPIRDDGSGIIRFQSAATGPVARVVMKTNALSTLVLTRLNSNGTTTNIPINTATATTVPNLPGNSAMNIPLSVSTNYVLEATAPVQVSMISYAGSGGAFSALSGFEDAAVAARSDNYTVGKNIARALNVLTNDTQAAGLALLIGNFTQPSNGTVVKNTNNTFTYTPNNNYLGTDEFTYIAQDADGNSSTATVKITITELDTTSVTIVVAKDRDNDGLSDEDDIDDDNDGIIDTAEGFCETTSVYTLNLNTTLSGATFGANGGNFNLVYSLTSGAAVPSIGNSFNVPFSYTDFSNIVNSQDHTWENFTIDGTNFAILPNTTSLYTGLPTDNQGIEDGSAGPSPSIDDLFRYFISTGKIVRLGNFSTTIGNLPVLTGSKTYQNIDQLPLFSRFNLTAVSGGGAGQYDNGYYANLQLQTNVNPANAGRTLPFASNYGSTYTWDYTAFSDVAGAGATNGGNRGLISIEQNTITVCNNRDTDGDGIPNYLDLDSDNDGCPDAEEGSATISYSQLVTGGPSLEGGNGTTPATPPTSGTYNTSVLLNLCAGVTCVNAVGLPQFSTLPAGYSNTTGQGVGTSADTAVNNCVCYNDPNTTTAGEETNHGITLLKRAGEENGNWPMIRKSAHTVLESNTKGFVITRATTTEITNILLPQDGMMVYDTVAKCLKLYDGSDWSCFVTPTCP